MTATIERMRFQHLRSTDIIQAELFQGDQTYTVVLPIILNSTAFPSISLSIRSTVQQKVDKK